MRTVACNQSAWRMSVASKPVLAASVMHHCIPQRLANHLYSIQSLQITQGIDSFKCKPIDNERQSSCHSCVASNTGHKRTLAKTSRQHRCSVDPATCPRVGYINHPSPNFFLLLSSSLEALWDVGAGHPDGVPLGPALVFES